MPAKDTAKWFTDQAANLGDNDRFIVFAGACVGSYPTRDEAMAYLKSQAEDGVPGALFERKIEVSAEMKFIIRMTDGSKPPEDLIA